MRFVVIALLLCSCSGRSQPPAAAPKPSEATQPPAEPLSFTERMKFHFYGVHRAQTALVLGELSEAKKSARELNDRLSDSRTPAVWQPYVNDVRAAATGVLASQELSGAGMHVAAMGRACGACHQMLDVAVRIPIDEESAQPPERLPQNIDEQMWQHLWAVNRMWDGLVGPSEELWQVGSERFAQSLDGGSLIPRGQMVTDQMEALLANMEELAENAKAASSWEEREAAYGALLGTCAGCHREYLDSYD